MDAHAYLLSQGWSGPGNPLNPNRRPGPHGGLGLTKPILVARKRNNHGLGKKTTHDHTNQWWLRGFEAALKGVGDDGSATPSSDGSRSAASGTSELYRFFVKGEALEGTIDRIDVKEVKRSDTVPPSSGKGEKTRKRKQGDEIEVDEEREEMTLKKKRRPKCAPNDQDSGEGVDVEDGRLAAESKEERLRRRKEKKEKKEKVKEMKEMKEMKENKEREMAKSDADVVDSRAAKKKRKNRQRLDNSDFDSMSQGGNEEANVQAVKDDLSDKKSRKKQKKLEKENEARRELKHKETEPNKNGREKRRDKTR